MSLIGNRKKTRNLKRFRRAKFNYEKFVKRYYIENEDAYISAKVSSIGDIVNPFSVKNYEWVNKEFVTYIEESAYYIPPENRIKLEICGCKFTPEQQTVIRRVILDYFGLQLEDKKDDLTENGKIIFRLIMGAVLAGIFYLIVAASPFYSSLLVGELISVLFWFFIWELVGRVLLERRQMKAEKLYAGQLADMLINFADEKSLTEQDPNIEELDELDELENFINFADID